MKWQILLLDDLCKTTFGRIYLLSDFHDPFSASAVHISIMDRILFSYRSSCVRVHLSAVEFLYTRLMFFRLKRGHMWQQKPHVFIRMQIVAQQEYSRKDLSTYINYSWYTQLWNYSCRGQCCKTSCFQNAV